MKRVELSNDKKLEDLNVYLMPVERLHPADLIIHNKQVYVVVKHARNFESNWVEFINMHTGDRGALPYGQHAHVAKEIELKFTRI